MMSDLVQEHIDLIEKLVKSNSKFSGNEDLLEDFCSETYQRSLMILQNVTDISNVQGYLKKIVNTSILKVLKNEGRMIKTPSSYSTSAKKEVMPEINEVPDTVPKELTETPLETDISFSTEESFNSAEILSDEITQNEPVENTVETSKNIETEETDNLTFEDTTQLTENLQTEEPTIDNNLTFENNESEASFNFDNTEEDDSNKENETSYLSFDSFDEKPQLVFDIPDPVPTVEEIVVSREILSKIYMLVRNLEAKNLNKHFLDIFNLRYFREMTQNEIADELGLSQGEVSKRLLELSLMIRQEFR